MRCCCFGVLMSPGLSPHGPACLHPQSSLPVVCQGKHHKKKRQSSTRTCHAKNPTNRVVEHKDPHSACNAVLSLPKVEDRFSATSGTLDTASHRLRGMSCTIMSRPGSITWSGDPTSRSHCQNPEGG